MKISRALLLLVLLTTGSLRAENAAPPAGPGQTGPTPAVVLASQVGEIASATNLSRSTQEKLIARAVQLAIATAIEGIKDPDQILNIATQLTAAATKAAPRFAETIMNTAASVPAVAAISGSLPQIQSAVLAGVKAAAADAGPAITPPAGNPPAPSAQFGGSNNGDVIVSPSS